MEVSRKLENCLENKVTALDVYQRKRQLMTGEYSNTRSYLPETGERSNNAVVSSISDPESR